MLWNKKGDGHLFHCHLFHARIEAAFYPSLMVSKTTRIDRSTAQITPGTLRYHLFLGISTSQSLQHKFFWTDEMVLERGTHFRQTHSSLTE